MDRIEQHAWRLVADMLDPQGPNYLEQPDTWAMDQVHKELWSKQREIALSVANNRRTAVHSCHNAGKSFVSAVLASWWIATHRPGSAFVVTTAPTAVQVKAILWREINRLHGEGNLPGRVNMTEWLFGNELIAFGRKPDDMNMTAFQGIHAEYVLVIIDEACGVTKALWDAASTLTSNAESRILAIGNPDDPSSHFATVCMPDSGWNVVHIAARDTPNFTGEPVPDVVRRSLVSDVWVNECEIEWGVDSPLYISKVLGQFPDESEDGIILYSWLQRCKELELSEELPVELGVDVGAGGDETVIYERRGMKAGRKWKSRHKDAMKCVGEVVQAIEESGATSVKIDVIGVGWGVSGRLKELRAEGVHHANIIDVNVANRAKNAKKFLNVRAEMWWEVGRELSRQLAWDLSRVDDRTVAELVSPKYSLNSQGRIVVESKDDIRSRIGRSTNDADALLMAFYTRNVAAVSTGSQMNRGMIPGVRKH